MSIVWPTWLLISVFGVAACSDSPDPPLDGGTTDGGSRDAAATDGASPDVRMTDSAVADGSPADSAAADSGSGDAGIPASIYSTYLGGSGADRSAGDQVTDAAGNLYVAGNTSSTDFPVTAGAYDTSFNSTDGRSDGFVMKIDASGDIVWATYLGGSTRDELYGIAVDAAGFVYVAGGFGPGAPTTAGAVQPGFAGGDGSTSGIDWDGYIAKLTPDGSDLVWASYLGTSANEAFRKMVIDSAGNVIVIGTYIGTAWPASWFAGSWQPSPAGGDDQVVIKVSTDGSSVLWASYVGGSDDEGRGGMTLAIDGSDRVHVATLTRSSDLPVTTGSHAGGSDVYVARLTSDGAAVELATYVGSPGDEGLGKSAITLDGSGNIYLSAYTSSSTYPTTAGAAHRTVDEASGSGSSAVVVKLSPTGSVLAATYTGHRGSSEDVAVDSAGNVYTIGNTNRPGRTVSAAAFQSALGGGQDGFIEVLSGDLGTVVYSSYLGGRGEDSARMNWVDARLGVFYVFGTTTSADFPTRNAVQPSYGGGTEDVFITRLPLP